MNVPSQTRMSVGRPSSTDGFSCWVPRGVDQRGAKCTAPFSFIGDRNGKPERESTRSTKEKDAIDLLKQRQSEITSGRFTGPQAEKVTVQELAEDLKTDYRANGKKSLEDLEWRLKHLLPFLGHLKAQQVGSDRIKKYITVRQEQGAQTATINRELAALKRMYNLGLAAEKIFRKPPIRLLQENNVRRGFFEKGEFLALRRALPEHLRPVITFAYYTGWRKSEILNLKWKQVDLNNQTVRLDPGTTKNRRGRTIVVHGELLQTISEQAEQRKRGSVPGHGTVLLCPYVFHRKGKPIRDFRDSWGRACVDAGLAGRLFHDFRRTAVRNLVRAGVPDKVAMEISGHETRSIFDRYDIVDEEDHREAARRIWEHIQAQPDASDVVPLKAAVNDGTDTERAQG